MARSPDGGDWPARYAVIEKAYREGRWDTVMETGTLFLRELPETDPGPDLTALRHRAQLLVAHTLLHGYGDRDAAEDLYELVRQSDGEPALRQIAEDGLNLCHQPLASTLTVDEDGMEEDSTPSPPLLFLPEKERAELAKAAEAPPPLMTPSPAVTRGQQPARETEAEPEEAATDQGLGLAADPFVPSETTPTHASLNGLPVMPWLERQPTPKEATSTPPSVVAEVVEEPELIEVYQASPALAENVDLEVAPAPQAPQAKAASKGEAAAKDDGGLRAGLLAVVVG